MFVGSVGVEQIGATLPYKVN